MSKTTNKFSPEVRERAVRMVREHEGLHGSRWSAIVSISAKIGCAAQTLNEWVKEAEVESGRRAGIPSEMSERLKAFEREDQELRQVEPWSAIGLRTMAREILRKASASITPLGPVARRDRLCDGGARPPVEVMVSFIDAH